MERGGGGGGRERERERERARLDTLTISTPPVLHVACTSSCTGTGQYLAGFSDSIATA